jgi:hypothetical protein
MYRNVVRMAGTYSDVHMIIARLNELPIYRWQAWMVEKYSYITAYEAAKLTEQCRHHALPRWTLRVGLYH